MAIRTPSIKIKDCEYTIRIMDAERGFAGLGLLSKFLGGPLGDLLATGIAKASPELVASALREIGQHLASQAFRDLIYDMLEGSFVDYNGNKTPLIVNGNREIFKGHFAGEMGALIGLAWFAIKENFGNFLDGIPGAAEVLSNLRAKLPVPPLPTGKTGG